MRSVPKVSCIIPFWNEDNRIFTVLDEVTKVENISEIICVDDASLEDASSEIKKRFPEIILLRLEKNTGKSGAVREGLKLANGEFVILIDADLRNLDHREIDKAVKAIVQNGAIDMLILRRVNASFMIRLERGDILFTGERIIRKNDLEKILQGRVNGWQLESAINTWMYLNRKKVYWMPHSGINTHKVLKWGLMTGLWQDMKTFYDMVSATGFPNFVRQALYFGKDELKTK